MKTNQKNNKNPYMKKMYKTTIKLDPKSKEIFDALKRATRYNLSEEIRDLLKIKYTQEYIDHLIIQHELIIKQLKRIKEQKEEMKQVEGRI